MSHEYELQISKPIAEGEGGQLQARRTHDLPGGDVVTVRIEVRMPDGSRVATYLDVPLEVWREVSRD
jgi:hypothetical protein